MNPNAHLSTILVLGKDNRFRAYSHSICDSAEIAEQAGAEALTHLSGKNPGTTFINRTMPFRHITNTEKLNILL